MSPYYHSGSNLRAYGHFTGLWTAICAHMLKRGSVCTATQPTVAITAWISSKVYVCMYVEQAVEYSSETIVGVTETENKNKNKNKTETETEIEQRAVCGDAVTRRA